MSKADADAYKTLKARHKRLLRLLQLTSYSYAVTPAGCDNGANGECTAYTLTATLEGTIDGSGYLL